MEIDPDENRGLNHNLWVKDYLISTVAPASSNCFFKASASALSTPVLTSFGAPSTKSLASFKPRPVRSFTSLTTPNFEPPASFKITSKDVCSAAAAGASPPPTAATATAAAAGSIPYSSLRIWANSLTSLTVKFTNCSANDFKSAVLF